ncbi:MAG: hypothetical protein HY706_01375 [Candidatus Hydrogenedentes bacterium]|nr:hypothetical protein [Candidatus Hydrogenedentota bacterium]
MPDFKWLSPDTTPEAARVYFDVLRKIGMEGRARMAFELSDNLRSILQSGVRMRHPDYDEHQVWLAAVRLSIGDELFKKAYPGVDVMP